MDIEATLEEVGRIKDSTCPKVMWQVSRFVAVESPCRTRGTGTGWRTL
jgi:hypothetical protein